jgi:predicted acetyltransferase
MSVVLLDAWRVAKAAEFFRSVWPMYVHEISGYDTDFFVLDHDGRWQPDLAGDWLAAETPRANLCEGVAPLAGIRQPYQRTHVIVHDERPVGFACVGLRPFKYMPAEAELTIAEFFVIHALRGESVGRRALELLLASYSGRWQLRVLHDNTRALRFWSRALPQASAREVRSRSEHGDVVFRFVTGTTRDYR